ncbi:Chromosome partitioning ATPase, Mrp family, contains Fe-S cluster [Streptomyces zhaozhouensis]|uniref:Chromosome partitioning ATPase, Mrp family, contains Fe-S cluster n=1 Tax=Streptomyces zhaozhouensis TaxID=1300267 RepID=A0A286DJW3_9ACTN|nr:lipopolysaccharide biosynthesis protein [Streptomyces zhaozhouensis]SOD59037.1 Chromosome partitioning ATPase, Mrp family, contains Fe-S cluster [Streptomyces zhaozhouensis]
MSAVAGAERAAAPHQPWDEPDLLRDQFRQLLRYRALIICGILLGLAGGAWLGLTANESYVATGEVSLRTPTADPFADPAPMDRVAMGSERRTAVSDIVAERAAQTLGTSESVGRLKRGLTVTNPPNTQVLRFAYSASDPEVAAQRAGAFVTAYLANRQADADETITQNVASLEGQREPLLERRDQLQAEVDTLVEGTSPYDLAVADLSQVVGQIAELNSDISALRALDTTGGRVITEAAPPSSPAGPGLPLLLGLGYVVGIGLGLLAAWVRLVFDPTVRSAGDVTRALRAPVLGVLPRAGRDPDQLLAEGRLAEEYRSIAFRLAYDEAFAQRRRLLVVAPRGGIDTPLAAAVNVTAAFAEMGMNALLVEADLRTPTLTDQLRHADGVRPGWAHAPARADGGGWPAGMRVPIDAGESGIFDLVPGRRVRNVPRALTSPAATELIGHADERGSVVVVLAPPVLSYADAIALTDRVDGVLVVCDPAEVRREDLARVRELVVGAGGSLLGAVLHSWGNGSERARGRTVPPPDAPAAPAPRQERPRDARGRPGPERGEGNSETMGLRVLDPAEWEDGDPHHRI